MAIKVNAVIIDNGYSPVEIPLSYGNFFDGEFFYFFESEEEAHNYLINGKVNSKSI